jgi:hypothetical protein
LIRSANRWSLAAGLRLCFIVSTLIAWLAVRYDWGYKSRF